ncbi:MAG: aconitate hydratase AcnA [Proteobacteria bacterium]|nr:aconitate hydratase AcnA [Pseudomonadota bacterium]
MANETQILKVGDKQYRIHSLHGLAQADTLPFSLKVLLENLLRTHDGVNTTDDDITALLNWGSVDTTEAEIGFTPARVVMQDFTGVPAIVDLASMRDAVAALGGDPDRINPLSPAELVIDHSVQVDAYGTPDALDLNAKLEFQRNQERYGFLRWGQSAFSNLKVVPPATGIVHQVNLEYLARVVFTEQSDDIPLAYPDSVVGTDSHTTMINGLGVLGWGVGGIEAEAAMLGQPISMLIPEVVGFELKGRLAEGATATDLVLTVTEMLRARGVVGKFVEFFGDGLQHLPLADRATISNMAPEYGATCGIFPIDEETLKYLRLTNRSEELVDLVEAYARHQGMWHDPDRVLRFSDTAELDLADVVPSIAGPRRPQDRIRLDVAGHQIRTQLDAMVADRAAAAPTDAELEAANSVAEKSGAELDLDGETFELKNGACVIAAITSCTNTSNPSVMIAAGLLARNALARGLKVKPWVKTSFAPGSKVVTDYLLGAGLTHDLDQLGFNVVGYGCTTCIGNSGPLPAAVSEAIAKQRLVVSSVLSGNRNFEGRIHQEVRMNFLASPPLVVAYALAGRVDFDPYNEPLGHGDDGKPVFLKDVWPSEQAIHDLIVTTVNRDLFEKNYADVFSGDQRWRDTSIPQGSIYEWDDDSTYIRRAPFFDGMTASPGTVTSIEGARCLALLGDSITTDHISPAGAIIPDSPAGQYLLDHGVSVGEFNSYGSRRGSHEVMVRGTFANTRLKNLLAPGTEGGWTTHYPGKEVMTIYAASQQYASEGTPLVVLAGKEYGTGSSRDWAAKGTLLLGVRAVIAASYERIHRSNLVGMGVLPLQFREGEDATSLGLTGAEVFGISEVRNGQRQLTVTASGDRETVFEVDIRIDTPKEWDYYLHGGILPYVVRSMLED